ncbi:hypothetical protein ACFVIZ_35975 [Streptomyces anulatus]|uniref:hypothetical protein n=1 Tax=Streptomyces anulatus TaxID=1892 RepID=UPI0036260C1E
MDGGSAQRQVVAGRLVADWTVKDGSEGVDGVSLEAESDVGVDGGGDADVGVALTRAFTTLLRKAVIRRIRFHDPVGAFIRVSPELSACFKETVGTFDSTPFADDELQWNLSLEELEHGIW